MTSEQNNKDIDLASLKIERDKKPRGKSVFRYLIWIIIAALLVAAYKLWAPQAVPFLRPEVSTVRAVVVSPSQAATVLTASGYIVARRKAEISPKSVGRIAWINLEEGQKVQKGQLVARLENQELLAQRSEASANLGNARKELTRQKELFRKGITSQQALDNADRQVQEFSSKLRYIEEQIRNTEIYAPINGVVTVKKAFLGETVTPQGFGGAGSAGATFAVIVDLDSLEMEADINEQNLGKIRLGMPAEVTLDAYPDNPYPAELRQIVPTADRQKGSVKIKVGFVKKDSKVLPEMSCRVSFQNQEALKENKSLVKVPVSSIAESKGAKGVFLIDQDVVKFKPLTLGGTAESQIEVKEGLSGGEEVVVDAAKLNLKDGQRVRRKAE